MHPSLLSAFTQEVNYSAGKALQFAAQDYYTWPVVRYDLWKRSCMRVAAENNNKSYAHCLLDCDIVLLLDFPSHGDLLCTGLPKMT